jgi:hypothetical protein|tara:strand:+ start:1373 stop:1489 length:117 start_codon:yes stop_codon:yes gene_type:complete
VGFKNNNTKKKLEKSTILIKIENNLITGAKNEQKTISR